MKRTGPLKEIQLKEGEFRTGSLNESTVSKVENERCMTNKNQNTYVNIGKRRRDEQQLQKALASGNQSIYLSNSANSSEWNLSKSIQPWNTKSADFYSCRSTPERTMVSPDFRAYLEGTLGVNIQQSGQFTRYHSPTPSLVGSPAFDLSKSLESYDFDIPYLNLSAPDMTGMSYEALYLEVRSEPQIFLTSLSCFQNNLYSFANGCSNRENKDPDLRHLL